MMNAKTCNSSLLVHGVYICKLDCKPCPVMWDASAKCAEERLEEMADAFEILLNGDKK